MRVMIDGRFAVAGVALAVRDVDRCSAFYRDAIGLAVIDRAGGVVRMGVGGSALLELRGDPGLRPRDPVAAGLFHTAFLLPERADLGRWLDHAAETGLKIDGAADHLVSEAVYLSDPEGNGVEIYADRPNESWTWRGTQVVMANDRLDFAGLHAAAGGVWAGAPEGTRIGHVHLQVGDAGEGARFYTGRLGLDVTRLLPEAAFLSADRYHHHLAVNQWHSAGAGPRDPGRAGLAEIVFHAVKKGEAFADPWGNAVRTIPFQQGPFT